MTGQAGVALEYVSIYISVLLGHVGLVAVLMTVDTTELAVISRVEMAIRTLAPFALVITGIYGKESLVVVLHLRRLPTGLGGMAHGTVCSESTARMVGIDRSGIVCHVA